jgi:transposase InsO family protein
LTVSVNQSESLSLESIRSFLLSSEEISFESQDRQQQYAWIEQLLIHHQYATLNRSSRGLLRRYIAKMTGLSRAQVTRLIALYTATGRVRPKTYRRHSFPRHYTAADIELLAATDEAHQVLSGPATRHILQREYTVYGKAEYERLATISVGHLYNLRQHPRYRQRLRPTTKTKPTQAAIGIRKKPEPAGRPGYLRVDTVHQGDPPGKNRGVYHINAVDEVTQWEVTASVERISEIYLLPVLEQMLRQFPFEIRGFHSDNGSEYINGNAARLLEKLHIEQTKSRPRHCGDNGLVETKNGAVIRKQIGYGYIDSAHAEALNGFYRDFLNPYLNFHRPCAQPEVTIDKRGRKRVKYRQYRTPLETLLGLENPAQYLRPGLSLELLQRMAGAVSDTAAARRMQKAKEKLFEQWQKPA